MELHIHDDRLVVGIRQLAAEEAAIEAEFGEPLGWQGLPTTKASHIAIVRDGFDPADSTTFPQQH